MTSLLCGIVFFLNGVWAISTVWMWGTGQHICGHSVGWFDWATTLFTFLTPMVLAACVMAQRVTIYQLRKQKESTV